MLTENLKTEYSNDSGFVNKKLRVQEYPKDIIVENAIITGDTATVKVKANYTEYINWRFELIKTQDGWKISKIG